MNCSATPSKKLCAIIVVLLGCDFSESHHENKVSQNDQQKGAVKTKSPVGDELKTADAQETDSRQPRPHRWLCTTRSAMVENLAYTMDGKRLVATNDEGALYLWDISSGAGLPRVCDIEKSPNTVAISPTADIIAVGHGSGVIEILSTKTGERIKRLKAHFHIVGGIEFIEKGTRLVSVGWDGDVLIWDTSRWTVVRSFHSPVETKLTSLAVSSHGKLIAATTSNPMIPVLIWNVENGKQSVTEIRDLKEIEAPLKFSTKACFLGESAVLAFGGHRKHLLFWDCDNHKQIFDKTGFASLINKDTDLVRELGAAPGHKNRILFSNSIESARLIDRITGTAYTLSRKHELERRFFADSAMSPDGRTIAIAGAPSNATDVSENSVVSLWSIDDFRLAATHVDFKVDQRELWELTEVVNKTHDASEPSFSQDLYFAGFWPEHVIREVNLWRKAIKLPELQISVLSKHVELRKVTAGYSVETHLTQDEQGINKRHSVRAAMIPHDTENWVFFVIGESAAVTAIGKSFTSFIQSLTIDEDGPHWQLPAGWKQIPDKSPFRFALLEIGDESNPLKMSIAKTATRLSSRAFPNTLPPESDQSNSRPFMWSPLTGSHGLHAVTNATYQGQIGFKTPPEHWMPGRRTTDLLDTYVVHKASYEIETNNKLAVFTVDRIPLKILRPYLNWSRERTGLTPLPPDGRQPLSIPVNGLEGNIEELRGDETTTLMVDVLDGFSAVWVMQLHGDRKIVEEERNEFLRTVRSIRFR